MNVANRFVPSTKTASIANGASGWDFRGVAMPKRWNDKGREHCRESVQYGPTYAFERIDA
jgi:hypothetical protein